MAKDISPEEMAMMQEQAGNANQEPVTKIAQDVGMGLQKLSDLLDSSAGATDQDKAQMAQIMGLYADLVDKKLNQAPGEDEVVEEQGLKEVNVNQGMKGVPMGPESRN